MEKGMDMGNIGEETAVIIKGIESKGSLMVMVNILIKDRIAMKDTERIISLKDMGNFNGQMEKSTKEIIVKIKEADMENFIGLMVKYGGVIGKEEFSMEKESFTV